MKNRTKLVWCMLGLFAFIGIEGFNIWQSLKYYISPTAVVEGFNFSYYQSITIAHIKYLYTVDGKIYQGDTSVYLHMSKNPRHHILIRYLVKDPGSSMADDLIMRELITDSVFLIFIIALTIWMLLAIIGKLPLKNQQHFNKYINL